MNPTLLAMLLRTVGMGALQTGAGNLTTAQATPALWGSPEAALDSFDQAKLNAEDKTPIDRIKAAFSALKDMHKGPDQTEDKVSRLASSDGPSAFDSAQWPFGPLGAPSQAMARAQASVNPMPSVTSVPLPRPRPEAASAQDTSPIMSFFQRNAALQKDPITGDYLDPQAASRADAGIFKGLFS